MARFGAILAFGCLLYFTSSVLCQIDIGLPKSEAEAIGAVETVAAIAAIQRQMRAAMAPGGAPISAPAPDDEVPSWAGKPILRQATKAATAEASEYAPSSEAEDQELAKHGKSKNFPVTNIETFEKLSDTELFEIFHQGVADIPSALPNQLGKYTMCAGDALLNVFTTQGWPNGTLPIGDYNVFNQFFERFWRGKVMHTDPTTGQTKLWNLILNNSTVDIIGNVSIVPGGISKDGRDSAVVHYNKTNAIFFRPLEDEMRRVGPNTWLGRAWVMNPVEGWYPTDVQEPFAPAVDIARTLNNATFMAGLATVGFEGPFSGPTMAGDTYPTPGEPLALLYFSLDCADFPVPKLHYTPIVAPVSAIVSSVTGYNTPFYSLPDLYEYNNTGDPGAVDNWMKSFPFSTDTSSEPYVLWPYTFEEPAGPLSGYLQLPAALFQPIFGPYWELTNQTMPLVKAVEQATAPASQYYQNVDNLFPGIDRIVNVNPLTALEPAAKQAYNAADAAFGPATAPAAEALASAAKQAVAPIADAIQKGSLQITGAFAPAVQGAIGAIPNVNSIFGPQAPLPSAVTGPINSIAREVARNVAPSGSKQKTAEAAEAEGR